MRTKQTCQKTFLLLKVNANSKAVLKMDTHQTKTSLEGNSYHMIATSSTLVMHRTLWMAPTFCTATMAFGTLAFPRARVCTHSVLTWRWTLNYHYHLEKVRSNYINAFQLSMAVLFRSHLYWPWVNRQRKTKWYRFFSRTGGHVWMLY